MPKLTLARGSAALHRPKARRHAATVRLAPVQGFARTEHVRFYPQAGKAPESLFRTTPPTALIFEVAEGAVPAFAFLAGRGLSVPRDVSLVCAFPDGAVQWCDPPLAHLRTEGSHIVRRIVRWVRAVSRGRADRDAVAIPATFDPGGTIGPARV